MRGQGARVQKWILGGRGYLGMQTGRESVALTQSLLGLCPQACGLHYLIG